MSASGFFAGLLGERHSIATGLMIALVVWTLTRLVNEVTDSGTLEYDIDISDSVLADGSAGHKVEVTITNLSHDTVITNLQASISGSQDLTFSGNRADRRCAFEPPAWGENPICDGYTTGLTFAAPMLVPGTHAQFGIKYRIASESAAKPIVRIRPDGTSNVRLIKPGVETFLARHETKLLLALLLVAGVLFFVSVRAGVSSKSDDK
jgi:hypothetical protein